MRCPYTHFAGISCKDIIMLADFYFNRTVSSTAPGVHVTVKFFCNNMKTKTYSQYRQSEIEILAAVPCTLKGRASSKNDSPASFRNLFFGGRIGYQFHFNFQISQCSVNEVIELAEIIDYINGKHHDEICINAP